MADLRHDARALDLGLVGLAQFLPGILLFLVAGHTADRFPRQRILQCCYVAFACISALLSGIHRGTGFSRCGRCMRCCC